MKFKSRIEAMHAINERGESTAFKHELIKIVGGIQMASEQQIIEAAENVINKGFYNE